MSKDAYWTSDKGINVRLEDLAEHIAYRTYNNAIQVYAANSEVYRFEWVTSIDESTCNYCDGQSGRRYRKGQFMPQIPAHIGCRCAWDVLLEEIEL